MRRRILAGVISALAGMAEIGEVREITGGEFPPQRHRRENGAIPFAIATGIADFHLPPGFNGGVSF